MKTIIFKSEKKAKVYEVVSAISQGIYNAGEVILKIKTDNIELARPSQYQTTAREVK